MPDDAEVTRANLRDDRDHLDDRHGGDVLGDGHEGDEAHEGQDQYDLIVDALARGEHYADAGSRIGRSERSVRRRMADEGFARKVKARRLEMVTAGAGRFNAALDHAVETVLGLLDDPDPALRLRAAKTVMEMGSQLTERAALESLVRKVEDRLGHDDRGGSINQ